MEKKQLNGWLFRWFKHLWCGMIYGHNWKNIPPSGCFYQCQECTWCGKERVI